jgi:hypothetical protein
VSSAEVVVRFIKIIISIVIYVLSGCLLASEESPSVLGSFSINSKGHGSSGPITVSGTASDEGIEELKIYAFGKEINLGKDGIIGLRGIMVNGLQVSYDGGYGKGAGRSFIIVFTTAYAADVVDKRYVIVNDAMKVEVRSSL